MTLDAPKFKAFQYAVKHHYWYQMYIDDMPMWALVGVGVPISSVSFPSAFPDAALLSPIPPTPLVPPLGPLGVIPSCTQRRSRLWSTNVSSPPQASVK